MVITNILVYPFLLKCCAFTNDNFWKYVFEDLAYGKPPYGTYITHNFLCCKYKDKEFSYKICDKKSAEKLLSVSTAISQYSFGVKALISFSLSEVIFKATD